MRDNQVFDVRQAVGDLYGNQVQNTEATPSNTGLSEAGQQLQDGLKNSLYRSAPTSNQSSGNESEFVQQMKKRMGVV